MKLEENKLAFGSRTDAPSQPAVAADSASPVMAEVGRRLLGNSPRFVGIAPGRFDIMGGLADYTGALVLGIPLNEHACVAAQERQDGIISVVFTDVEGRNGSGGVEIPLRSLRGDDARWITPEAGRNLIGLTHGNAETCVVGTIVEAFRAGLFPTLETGLSISLSTTLEGVDGSGRHAAIAAAVLTAVAGLCGQGLEPQQATAICEAAEQNWLGIPTGPADAVTSLLGEPGVVSQFRCDARTMCGSLRLPDHLRLVAIHLGAKSDGLLDRYADVRTTSFMGRLLIDRIVRHDGLYKDQWRGFLSRVSVGDFVERFRDRLPTRLKGSDFLAHFGETGDPLTSIDPDATYRIRSRTEHHVYEHNRSRQFVEAISRAARTRDRRALLEAGEIMFASHWSFGQRCGLGSIEADALVTLLRQHGESSGIFGARITSRGCGGIVGVLCDDGDRTHAALSLALSDYARKTGCHARVLSGSREGSMISGPMRV